MPSDNFPITPGSGESVRVLVDVSSNGWPAGVACYATTVSPGANVLQVVTPSTPLPVTIISGGGSGSNAAASATGAAVPADADYVGLNVAGTLTGQTGFNLAGHTIAHTDLTTVDGAAFSLGQAAKASSLPVTLASDQGNVPVAVASALPAGSNSIGTVALGAGSAAIGSISNTAFTANAGTNLNTSLLALEAGGNLAAINTKTPALGQALAAASVPVVLTTAQLATLTPLSAVSITGTVPVSGTFWQATQPVSGTVTANAGTNMSTASLALETGGNLATLVSRITTCNTGAVVLAAGSATIGAVNLAVATSGGATPYSYITSGAANQDAANIKSSAGQLYGLTLTNTTSSVRYVRFYNVANPTSASTPVQRFMLPANGGVCPPIPAQGMAFSAAISFRATTGPTDADAGACSASDVLLSASFD